MRVKSQNTSQLILTNGKCNFLCAQHCFYTRSKLLWRVSVLTQQNVKGYQTLKNPSSKSVQPEMTSALKQKCLVLIVDSILLPRTAAWIVLPA